MPNRNFEEPILWDPNIRDLSPEAFMLFFRMIMIADDFGIVPADAELLRKLTWWPDRLLRKFSGISQELPEKNFLGLLYHNGNRYYVIKPESWDRTQAYNIRKRTQSKYLKLKAEEAKKVRDQADWPFSKNISGTSQERLRTFLHNARASNASASNNNTLSVLSTEENPERDIDPVSVQKSSITLTVDLLKELGTRTKVQEYADISHVSWEPKLRAIAIKIGHKCLYHEAEKFCNWFEGQIENGKLSPRATHNPRSRFLNSWLNNVKPEAYTSNDELWHPNSDSTAVEKSAYEGI